jgi:hypothetical protein
MTCAATLVNGARTGSVRATTSSLPRVIPPVRLPVPAAPYAAVHFAITRPLAAQRIATASRPDTAHPALAFGSWRSVEDGAAGRVTMAPRQGSMTGFCGAGVPPAPANAGVPPAPQKNKAAPTTLGIWHAQYRPEGAEIT